MDVWQEKLLPAKGVYAAFVDVNNRKFMGVVNIGSRPTFYKEPSLQTVEVHLLDFDSNIYGQKMHLFFIERVRTEKRFANSEELMVQINQDIQFAREVLAYETNETNLST